MEEEIDYISERVIELDTEIANEYDKTKTYHRDLRIENLVQEKQLLENILKKLSETSNTAPPIVGNSDECPNCTDGYIMKDGKRFAICPCKY